jgi:site-specific DNA recombinase
MAQKNSQLFKIGFYVRVSTEEQAENPEGSIKNQEERLRQAVDYKNRIGTFGEIKGVYVDAGISAKDMRRPKLQELLRAVRSGEIDLIMVTEISRLSRSIRDFVEMWDLMQAHGCRFSSLREDFDTTNAAGEMVLFQLMNLAQFERKQTSERVGANIAVRAGRGLYNGGLVPVGYRKIADRPGYLEIDPEMAETVKAAFVAFLREGCLAHAALWLNNNGYTLKRHTEGGGNFKRIGHFTVDNLQAMLRNKAYLGIKVFHHKGELKQAKAVWPAIIDEVTFTRAGQMLDKNRRRYKPHKAGKMVYLFSGVVFCKSCGSHMSGKSATGRSEKVGYYEHSWATKRDSTLSKKIFRCEPHRIPSRKLEPEAWGKVVEFVTNPKFVHRVLDKVRERHRDNPHRKEMERLKSKICGIGSQIDALSERLSELPKGVSAAPIFKQMEKLQVIQRDHEEALLEAKNGGVTRIDRIVGLDTFEDFASSYRNFVTREADVTRRKLMIQKFIRKVEVGSDTFKISYIVDQEHYKRELAFEQSARPVIKRQAEGKISENCGSNTLTFGPQDWT